MLVSCICLFGPYSSQFNTTLYTQVVTSQLKNWLNFGSHLHLDRDPGIFSAFFNIARWAFFQNYGHISMKTDRIFLKILSEMYCWTMKSTLNFYSTPPVIIIPMLETQTHSYFCFNCPVDFGHVLNNVPSNFLLACTEETVAWVIFFLESKISQKK